MLSKQLTSALVISGIAFLLIILVSQHTESSSRVRERIEVKEAFQNADVETPVTGVTEMSELSPSPATIDTPRQPYHLLKGVFPDAATDTPSTLTAEGCYKADFSHRLEKTENYIQRTNNYKRGAPDSCSAPLSVFVNSFYKVDPLA